MRFKILLIQTLLMCICFAQAQSNPASSPQSGPPSAGGFSMEVQIFAYRALQSDAEAIALDVAKIGEATKFVIVPSTSNLLSNFQVWRANIATANELLEVAATCPKCTGEVPECPPKPGETVTTEAFSDVATGIGSLVTATQGILSLFATSQSAIGVQGAIQDQALIDAVARQLRIKNLTVLAPDTYGPYTLGAPDFVNSPFLNRLKKLVLARICLNTKAVRDITELQVKTGTKTSDQNQLDAAKKAAQEAQAELDKIQKDIDAITKEINKLPVGNPRRRALESRRAQREKDRDNVKETVTKKENEAQAATAKVNKDNSEIQALTTELGSLQSLISSIDSFVAGVTGSAPLTAPAGPSAGSPPSPGGSPSTPPATNTTPPLIAILSGDGLARAMRSGAGDTLPLSDDLKRWKVLYLKALESGGSLITKTNVFGSKVYFSGGAVATYALFDLEGPLRCSGNVFDYGGFVKAEDFVEKFRKGTLDPLDPSKQLIHPGSADKGCQ